MKSTAFPAPASVSAAKNAKTNPATPSAEKKPRAAVTPRPKPSVPPPASTKSIKATPALVSQPKTKTIHIKSVKTNSERKPAAVSHTVKVVNEPVLEGGALWKMSGKNGVAYIKDAAVAGELLATEPKNLAKRAMAVYYDKKGKAFAWQVRFDTDRWEEVMRRLG
jgi:hypothetical protein